MFFRGEYAFLSNMYESPLAVNGITYRCAEAAFQSFKTADRVERAKFASLSGAEARKMGRRVALRPDWEEIKIAVMDGVLRKKFAAPALREKLIATGDIELKEENTWGDRFWGVDARTGSGENRLGRLLMALRDEIKNS